jgi:hypothetical protein
LSSWRAIAKAEILVSSAKLRRSRKVFGTLIGIFVLLWALYIAPLVVSFLLVEFGEGFNIILGNSFPGLMRSIMLLLWLAVTIIPLSNALEEVKIGQWEIMLSNNVSTRDILIGTFLAKIPLYGLVTLFLSPILLSAFIIIYEISIIGQLLMYGMLVLLALGSLWFSNVLAAGIQSKLGQSARGNDIAKALSWAIIPIVAIPGMALAYFMPVFAEIMGLNYFLLLPSSWAADFITWMAVSFNGVNLPASFVANIANWLFIPALLDFALVVGFVLVLIGIGFVAADRFFVMKSGARTETIVTVGKENLFIRGVRRVLPQRFGVLVAMSLKDFGRKAQNLSKLGYGLFLVILMPVIMKFSGMGQMIGDPYFEIIMTMLTTGMMMTIFGAISFGGVGFMDSKAQMWIFKSNPKGESRFIMARLTSYFLLGLPYALVPAVTTTFILGLTITQAVLLSTFSYCAICSAAMIGIGVTAANPTYSDTKSGAFVINSVATIVIAMIAMMIGIIPGILTIIKNRDLLLGIFYCAVPPPIVGLIIVGIGAFRMIRSESA